MIQLDFSYLATSLLNRKSVSIWQPVLSEAPEEVVNSNFAVLDTMKWIAKKLDNIASVSIYKSIQIFEQIQCSNNQILGINLRTEHLHDST